MTEIKQPKIRFKGHINDWEQRKLGEVFQQTVEYIDPKEVGLELWSVTAENGLTPKSERYNREFLVKKNDKFKAIHPDEIVYNPMNMTLGSIGFNNSGKDVAVSGYYVTMKLNKGFDSKYFATWLPSPNAINLYKLYATGSLIERQRVQFPTLSGIKTLIPSLSEQTKIGEFFKTLDGTIALHKQKLEVTKQFKQTMLKKMFPKNGETTPEIRFKGFTEDWEECKLKDLCSLSTGKLDANAMTSDGKYTFFTSGEKVYKTDTFAFDGDAILIAGNGNVGLQHTYSGKFNAYQRTYVLMDFEINKEVLSNQIDIKLPRVIARETRVGVIPYIVKDMLTELPISFPKNTKEQELIGNYFKELDNQINYLEQKLEKYKEFKKAMLQKMFI